jgi:hypothetical protein
MKDMPDMQPAWNTDIDAAPRDVDLLVTLWNADRTDTCGFVEMAKQLYEPYEWEEGEESGAFGDAQGTFDIREGKKVVWHWYVGNDGITCKKEIAAWMLAPAAYKPQQSGDREGRSTDAGRVT